MTSTRAGRSAGKLYKIYDLANNGRLLKVRKDDPRYGEEDEALMTGAEPRYPHRKPSKATKQKYAVGEVIGSSPLIDAALSPTGKVVASAAIVSQAKRIPTILKAARTGAVALGTFAVDYGILGVGLAAAAGFGSYFATKWILENYPTKQRRLDAAADAYRKSRRDLAASLGRELTPAELAQLSAQYKTIVAAINR